MKVDSFRRDLAVVFLAVVITVVGGVGTGITIAVQAQHRQAAHDRKLAVQRDDEDRRLAVELAARSSRQVQRETCVQLNTLKRGVVGYIDGATARAIASATAMVQSPTTTQQQKEVAVRNLYSSLRQQQVVHQLFALDRSCVEK